MSRIQSRLFWGKNLDIVAAGNVSEAEMGTINNEFMSFVLRDQYSSAGADRFRWKSSTITPQQLQNVINDYGIYFTSTGAVTINPDSKIQSQRILTNNLAPWLGPNAPVGTSTITIKFDSSKLINGCNASRHGAATCLADLSPYSRADGGYGTTLATTFKITKLPTQVDVNTTDLSSAARGVPLIPITNLPGTWVPFSLVRFRNGAWDSRRFTNVSNSIHPRFSQDEWEDNGSTIGDYNNFGGPSTGGEFWLQGRNFTNRMVVVNHSGATSTMSLPRTIDITDYHPWNQQATNRITTTFNRKSKPALATIRTKICFDKILFSPNFTPGSFPMREGMSSSEITLNNLHNGLINRTAAGTISPKTHATIHVMTRNFSPRNALWMVNGTNPEVNRSYECSRQIINFLYLVPAENRLFLGDNISIRGNSSTAIGIDSVGIFMPVKLTIGGATAQNELDFYGKNINNPVLAF